MRLPSTWTIVTGLLAETYFPSDMMSSLVPWKRPVPVGRRGVSVTPCDPIAGEASWTSEDEEV
jgi:hypothetical protein